MQPGTDSVCEMSCVLPVTSGLGGARTPAEDILKIFTSPQVNNQAVSAAAVATSHAVILDITQLRCFRKSNYKEEVLRN